ncbi:Membrane protein insertase YidC [Eubacterium plexicaudatum ASF492]|uniref:YidC/Oxa1 family membrane protein insertase n=1 Tax=Eubacterium plexicaudatum ASF492 TaxID=1235802 RepID=N2B8L8_9FIRM|nr:Membrane protein insertase YidC [Eubacterium plexicaudatum ASF492]
MSTIILTQYSGSILGPIAKVLGWIMNWIYLFLANVFGIENIGITIIVLTILIYMCMLPLTIKQQKFSKLQQKMQPEIKAVQEKYKGKRDQESQMAMNEETQALYAKYGISPTGTCLPFLLQMPVFLALYRVIYNVPAYVSSVKATFDGVVDGIIHTAGFQGIMEKFLESLNLTQQIRADFNNEDMSVVKNFIVDSIYKMPTSGWEKLSDSFPNLQNVIESTRDQLNHMNAFLGLNISDSPLTIISNSFKEKSYLLVLLAFLIPLVSYASQMVNIKLMPQADTDPDNPMVKQMKAMNYTMPLISVGITFTVPVGLGIYWIFSSLTRGVQQYFVNKHIRNLDLDEMIAKNVEKRKKKLEKMGISENQIRSAAKLSTKSNAQLSATMSKAERDSKIEKAYEYRKTANPNSLTAKANLVKDFNERNNK